MSTAQEAALERLLSQNHHLGGRATSRDEIYEAAYDTEVAEEAFAKEMEKIKPWAGTAA